MRILRQPQILLLAATLVMAGCAGPRVQPLMPTPVLFTEMDVSPLDHIPEAQRWNPRRVYYTTTRQREDDLMRIDYSNAESDVVSVGMSLIGFGGPDVSWSDLIEYSRRAERPEAVDLTIAGLIEAGNFMVDEEGKVRDIGGAAAWLMADLNASIESARDQDLLIYVHGAKVNFYNANAFAAQLDHFMGRDMTSMAFSWPTRQNILAYGSGSDVRRAYTAAPALTALLELLARDSVARRIHIICWSAGGRVVNSALSQLHARHAGDGEDLRKRFRLGTVYFAAADVPGEEFLEALPALNDLATRIVVTVSSRDSALQMARTFMRGGSRIGQRNVELSEEQMDVVLAADRLEVVDVSLGWEGRGFDITGHRYWYDHPWASTDMILAVRSDLGPGERALAPTDLELLWGIPPDYPERLRMSLTREDLEIRRND
ncbi:alpha/beta hydrolase [Lentisalinibacter sediminis]|uniref:alpha/beta hydrolase n=1 Tax=Lentisalinibacter sediminis TaxID=2992237 RepID=UPI003869C827